MDASVSSDKDAPLSVDTVSPTSVDTSTAGDARVPTSGDVDALVSGDTGAFTSDNTVTLTSVDTAALTGDSAAPTNGDPAAPNAGDTAAGEPQGPEDAPQQEDPCERAARQLRRAAEQGDMETLERLLASDPSVAQQADADGYTALHRACYADKPEAARMLLDAAPGLIRHRTADGWQPLHSACKWGSLDCARLLMERGADVNATSEGALTPLHLAASQPRSRALLELLLWSPFIDTEARSRAGDRPADLASRHGPWASLFALHAPAANCF